LKNKKLRKKVTKVTFIFLKKYFCKSYAQFLNVKYIKKQKKRL